MKNKKLYHKLLLLVVFILSIAVLSTCKKKVDPPTVSTTAITEITVTSAMSGGNVTADGGAEVTARGVCWASTTQPTITNSKTSDSKGTGGYTSSITGLTENTTYYVRAYATNSEGTSYGNEVSFKTSQVVGATVTTTAASAITTTTATSGGNITEDGGGSIISKGICWSTTENPTTSNSKTSDGTGTGSFTSSITGLTPGTLYHIRAYATNSSGTTYGADLTFTTEAITATLTTSAVTNITMTTASSGGNITSDGGSAVTARGVCWSTSASPTVSGSHTSNGTGTGTFTSSISGLTANTNYYVRAYATNSAGTAYGNEVTFTSGAPTLATVTTTAAGSITTTSAVSGGNVTADGGAAVSARGVCWSTTSNPTTAGSKTVDGTGTGTFTSNLTGLQSGTTYHIRAYATNSAGTAYGNDLTFTTSAVIPSLATAAVTSITQTSAVSGGVISSTGGADITERGVCYGLAADPTISDSHTQEGPGNGNFTSNLSGLTVGTIYYLRAYATNSAGTAYGDQIRFSTVHLTGTLTDIEGNVYATVKIGNQWWMAENLKTTKYNDNTPIPNETVDSIWKNMTTDAYCWYFNDPATYKNTCGGLYNWYAATSTRKLCPAGWHVATDDDFKTLEMYLGMSQVDADAPYWRGTDQGTLMKATSGWSNGGSGNDLSGFNAVAGGYRYYLDGHFYDQTTTGSFMTTTEHNAGATIIYRNLNSNYTQVFRQDAPKNAGKAIRCVMD